jgi:serine protease Do
MGLEDMEGALVGDVLPDSPAGEAGLEAGDVIVGVDGHRVENTAQLRNLIAGTAPGTDVSLQVVRDSKPLELTATLAELPDDEGAVAASAGLEDLLGFSYKTVDRDLARRFDIDANQTGAVVTSIDQNSTAYEAGLREGDLIQSAERSRVRSAEDLSRVLSSKREGDTVLLRILRAGGGFFVAFRL